MPDLAKGNEDELMDTFQSDNGTAFGQLNTLYLIPVLHPMQVNTDAGPVKLDGQRLSSIDDRLFQLAMYLGTVALARWSKRKEGGAISSGIGAD
ncbi:hypothetical protein FRB91_011195 [Serendipita sp. 411]|nr:hypothetical protein FRC18_001745 [Serendipita sp. 400]KAG8848078.1 hypothetical protein FRB91_011195 [Serendipita sp. 411]